MLTGITLEELYEIRVEEAEERGAARAAKKIAEEKDRNYVMKLLRRNWSLDETQDLTDVPIDKILEIQVAIH